MNDECVEERLQKALFGLNFDDLQRVRVWRDQCLRDI